MKSYVCAAVLAGLALDMSPARASDTDRACATPKACVALVQQGHFDRIGELFAPDAVLYTPLGTVLHGAAAIGDFYKHAVASNKLVVKAQNFIGEGPDCFFEIWSRSKLNGEGRYVPDPDGEFMRAAADHFTVDGQGRVVQMVAFPAPNVSTVTGPVPK